MHGLQVLGTTLALLAAAAVAARSCGRGDAGPGDFATVASATEAGDAARDGSTAPSFEAARSVGTTARHGRPRTATRRRADVDAGPADAAAAQDAPVVRDVWAGRTHLIQGVVKMPDGSAVADALVTLGDLDDTDTATWSSADGTFGLDEMPSYSSVQAAAVRDGKVWRGKVGADGAPLDLVVTLAPPPDADSMCLVRVVGWDGGRVDGAHATIVRRGRAAIRQWDPQIAVGGGLFAVRPEPSEDGATPAFVVTTPVDAEGRSLPYGPVLVDAAGLRGPVTEFQLPPGVTLSGRVVGPDDAPVPRAIVSLVPPPPDGFDAASMETWTETTRSGDDGRFSFTGLLRGAGRLTVAASGPFARVSGREVFCGGGDVVVQLGAVVGATITVTDDAGKPVAGAQVWCEDPPDTTMATTGPDGRACLSGLRPGVATTLGVERADLVRTTVAGWIAADTKIAAPFDRPVCGLVLDAAGRPLPEAPLVVERRRPRSADPRGAIFWLDGHFVVPDMADGDEAELRLVDGMRVVSRAVVSAGTRDVRLVWDDPGRFGVTLEDSAWSHEDDAWRRGLVVTLRADGRDIASVAADAHTAHTPIMTFDAAPLPQRVDVQVGPLADGRWALLRDVAPRGVLHVPRDAWRSGRAVSGTVTTADGAAPDRGVTVIVSDADGFTVRVRANRTGAFRVPGVPSSPLTVRAECDDGAASAACVVDAGAESVVADLRLRE